MEPRDTRDLPEVVAEILIEQHAMREDIAGLRRDMQEMRGEIGGLRQEMKEEIGGLRQEVRTGLSELAQTFNNMTNAILDAMNRGNDRYNSTDQQIKQLDTRVTKLEDAAPDAA
ncbi:MAG: hypothetical protein JWP58_1116 [Hymenobacter sp.]|nr:hypothetical protein [Hymenobacter sp.]